jgi:hypothetical protein
MGLAWKNGSKRRARAGSSCGCPGNWGFILRRSAKLEWVSADEPFAAQYKKL